ncbi:hypothetical protein [Leptolyngbya sp. FACHB-711]|uniref:hypothetical protein n=2 Tax=Leptolyngbya TaxID=47251 RepID=UPI001689C95B|nr:hypothetical protein [Leptolyngbya sp. FACHB-711]MBD1851243.1 hypothetical protein [Cyanobacteria bacterium FACHB-502]MBD2027617.1 hypothetical protein [Leptolyngbya sp. FACHB-711]
MPLTPEKPPVQVSRGLLFVEKLVDGLENSVLMAFRLPLVKRKKNIDGTGFAPYYDYY